MGLRDEIKAVLAIEADGRRRLEEARQQGEEILRAAGARAEETAREATETLAGERAAARAEIDLEIAARIKAMEEEERLQKKALQAMADRNREAALERVLSWLGVGPR